MKANRNWALITGASSGIGKELAAVFAAEGWNLVLHGRDAVRLSETAEAARRSGIRVQEVVADLGSAAGTARVLAFLEEEGIQLDALVNNAGFSDGDRFAEMATENVAAMIGTNVYALTALTRAVLPKMISRRRGRILNLASTGSFFPCPNSALYAATKAFVLSLSEAIAEEVSGTGVTVTALCPGATATRFAARAGVDSSAFFRRAMPADRVARYGYRAMSRGKRIAVPGLANRLMVFSGRLMPRSVSVSIAGRSLAAN